MGGVIKTIAEEPLKAARAVLGEFTHLIPPAPVPAPPDPTWVSAVENMAEEDLERRKLARDEAEARLKQTQGAAGLTETQGEEQKIRLESFKKYAQALDDYSKLDPAQPDYSNKAEVLSKAMEWALAGYQGRVPTSKGGLVALGADVISGKDVGKGEVGWDNNPIDPEKFYKRFYDRKTDRLVWVDASNPHPDTIRVTSNDEGDTTVTRTMRGGAPLKPAPMNLGGGGAGAGAKSDVGKTEYWMLQQGQKLSAKQAKHAANYMMAHGLDYPAVITPADRKSFAGLSNLEATFPALEKYSTALDSTAKSLKLRRAIEAVTNQSGKGTGIMAAMEWLPGGLIDRYVATEIAGDPESQGFLVAYNQAREAVQTMRQFAGVSRSTQALYNAMAALLPNPVQTGNSTEAKQQLEALKQQIATIRQHFGLDGAGKTGKTTEADPLGGDSIPAVIPR